MAKTRDEDGTMKAINDQFAGVMGGLSHDDLSSSGPGSKSRRLSFKGMGSPVAAQMLPDGMKSLAPSGAGVVGQEMSRTRWPWGQPALSLLDVIPVGAARHHRVRAFVLHPTDWEGVELALSSQQAIEQMALPRRAG